MKDVLGMPTCKLSSCSSCLFAFLNAIPTSFTIYLIGFYTCLCYFCMIANRHQ